MEARKDNLLKDYFIMTIGVFIAAIAVNTVYEPVSIVTGGVTGIAIILKHVTENVIEGGIPIWIVTFVLNIPLFIIAFCVKGKKYIIKSLYATTMLSVALFVTQNLKPLTDDVLLSSIFGAAMAGLGYGLVFLAKGTTGGSDLAAALVHNYFRYYSMPRIIFVIDAVVVGIGAFVFGIEKALYSIIAIFIMTKIVDIILEGADFSKAVFIMSAKNDEIAKTIMSELGRGVTGLHSVGMYTKHDGSTLLCAVNKKQIIELKDIVKHIDADAFVMVADVREVLGKGFIEYEE